MNKRFFVFAALTILLAACSPLSNTATPVNPPVVVSPLPVTATVPENQPVLATAISTSTPLPIPTAVPSAAATKTVVQSSIPPDRQIQLPPGFGIGVYARGLSGPRMMAVGPDGFLYVAERGAGRVVRLPDRNQDGQADQIEVVADGIDAPNSLAFYTDGSLYVSETTRVWHFSSPDSQGVFQDRKVVIDNLPSGGHNTRTLLFSPDSSALYVSIGSSCNVCVESDNRRAAIMRFNPDGSGGSIFAFGLRNAVGITFRPGTLEMWATNNGRDNLGDTLPPETVYQVLQGKDYGWPRCYAGRIIDPQFGSADSCAGIEMPQVEMGAHMAPLGLTFYSGSMFPADYQGSLFIALHGSWNSTVPVGYKVMRVPVNNGVIGQAEDFATGWLEAGGRVWGRPVDVVVGPDGSLFVSDDGGGVIYRIFYTG